MLKRKALRKILITSFTIFTIFIICIVTNKFNNNFNPKIDVEYVNALDTDSIYLLGPDNYLVKTHVILVDGSLEEKVENIINYLSENDSSKFSESLHGTVSKNIKINSIKLNDKEISIDFSNLFSKSISEERTIESLIYSITDLAGIKSIRLSIDGNPLRKLPSSNKSIPDVLTKDFGINKVYDFSKRDGIQKVTMYYIDKIENLEYYVPVTKYLNDSREKINIIIENLSSNYIYDSNLMSFLKSNTELIDYQIDDELMLLNFNNDIFNNKKVLEETSYTIAYSVFDNYDVNTVLFTVNGQEVQKINK